MATYRSKLAVLEKLRTRARDTQRARVADALRADAALEQQLHSLAEAANAGREFQREARGTTIDPRVVLEMERYELVLKSQATTITQQRQVVAEELSRRRSELAAAEQQLRVVEKLDHRRRQRFEQEQSRTEQRTVDEIATQQYLRLRATDRHSKS